jgi:hypothetical protein
METYPQSVIPVIEVVAKLTASSEVLDNRTITLLVTGFRQQNIHVVGEDYSRYFLWCPKPL